MLTLHRFPLSHFSEKGRALLDFKGLDYRIAEHQLGFSQLGVWKLSGQRKVPVLDHDGTIVSDSTEIALYLEKTFPDTRPLLPADAQQRREVLELEERIDKVLGQGAPVVWFASLGDRAEVARLVDAEVYGVGRLGAKPIAALLGAGLGLGPVKDVVARAAKATRRMLEDFSSRLGKQRYLVGDAPTLADVAAVGLVFHLKFPASDHLALPDLAGRGVEGWVDDDKLARFFAWRERFYDDFLR